MKTWHHLVVASSLAALPLQSGSRGSAAEGIHADTQERRFPVEPRDAQKRDRALAGMEPQTDGDSTLTPQASKWGF